MITIVSLKNEKIELKHIKNKFELIIFITKK